MSQYGAELHKYILGETRVDGFQSEWLKDQLRRRAEDAAKPRPIVKAKQIIERQRRVGPRNATPRSCDVCGTGIRRINKTGRCINHKLEKRAPMQTTRKCGACDEPIRKTAFGVCKGCFIRYRRRIKQAEVRVCAEPECFYSLNKNTIYSKCRKHSRADRTAREVLRQWTKRQELKKAA